MANSRRKGYRGEAEWVLRVDGRKISRTGYEGVDVESPPKKIAGLRLWEVKRIERLPKWLEGWQDQMFAEGADAIAFRRDRGRWWVMVPADQLVEDDDQ